jgi:hypothetical protein
VICQPLVRCPFTFMKYLRGGTCVEVAPKIIFLASRGRLRRRSRKTDRMRGTYRWLATAASLLVTSAAALGAHAVLQALQGFGLVAGDYGSYAHTSVGPMFGAALFAAAAIFFLYVAQLAKLDACSAPILARAARAQLQGWKAVLHATAGAAALLAGMEFVEQCAVGRFDGWLSAFTSVPILGLAIVALASALAVAILRAVCAWLAGVHERIVRTLVFLLEPRRNSSAPIAIGRAANFVPVAVRPHELARYRGRRAPPTLA